MSKQNIPDTNELIEEGYHWVKWDGIWIIAIYEKTAYGRGYWYIHGSRDERLTTEFTEIKTETINYP